MLILPPANAVSPTPDDHKAAGSIHTITGVALTLTVLLTFSLIIGAYAGLLPLGHWQDEFGMFPTFLGNGLWSSYFSRLAHWSPRPLSELLIFSYAYCVSKANNPLIGPVLAFSWATLFLAQWVPIISVRHRAPQPSIRAYALLAMGLLCLFLLVHPVAEMFYWPMAALAYVVALAALCAVFWNILIRGLGSTAARLTSAALLTAAATTVEVGAMFVGIFCGLALAWAAFVSRRSDAERTPKIWLLVPLMVSAGVLLVLYTSRVQMAAEVFGDKAVAHHVWPVLKMATAAFFREAIAIDGQGDSVKSLFVGLVTKSLFFSGTYCLLRQGRWLHDRSERRAEVLALFSAACFVTAFLTIAAGFYQFGMMCCERHTTFRQCVLILGLASAAAAMAGFRPLADANTARRQRDILGPILLLIAVSFPAAKAFPGLVSDYENYRYVVDTNTRNWKQREQPGETTVYLQRKPGAIVGGIDLKREGTYVGGQSGDSWIDNLINFYGKKSLRYVTDQRYAKGSVSN